MLNNKKKIDVTIRCIAFNHGPYIRRCLEGFVMQKTNFAFEAVVHDDASTDETASIIMEFAEKYPDIIKPIIETENLYSRHDGSLERIVNQACRGKYIALCEGDDYWNDPYKLQKQYDWLETHPEYSFVYTGFRLVNSNNEPFTNERFTRYMEHSHSGNCFFDLLVNMNFIMTLTTFFRRECFENFPLYYYDYGNFLRCTRMGLAYYIPEVTSSYRVHPTSLMNTTPWILKPLMHKIVLNELKEALKEHDNTTSKLISADPLFRTVMGFVVRRYLMKSTCRGGYAKLLFRYPWLSYYVVKAVFIRLFKEDSFEKSVSNYR